MSKEQRKKELLINLWEYKSKGLSRKEKRELDDHMADTYGDSWERRTPPTLRWRIKNIFVRLWEKINFKKKRTKNKVEKIHSKPSYSILDGINPTLNLPIGLPSVENRTPKKKRKLSKNQIILIGGIVGVAAVAYLLMKKRNRK